jgi:hypothetical protein
LPNCFSIWPTAISMALSRSFTSSTGMMGISVVVRTARAEPSLDRAQC